MEEKNKTGSHKPRVWWLAAFLFLLSGMGYLYVGRPIRYLIYLVISVGTFVALSFFPIEAFSHPVVFLTLLMTILLASVLGFADVIRLAIMQKSYCLRPYNKIWIYLGTFIGVQATIMLVQIKQESKTAWVKAYRLPSASSFPNLISGDMVTAFAYGETRPQIGDIAVFNTLNNEDVSYVKRLIGKPGDKILIIENRVSINGADASYKKITTKIMQPIELSGVTEKYDIFEETLPSGQTHRVAFRIGSSSELANGEFLVPDKHYFVLGDNRDKSHDSRSPLFDYIPQDNIYAKVRGIYFNKDFSRIGLLED